MSSQSKCIPHLSAPIFFSGSQLGYFLCCWLPLILELLFTSVFFLLNMSSRNVPSPVTVEGINSFLHDAARFRGYSWWRVFLECIEDNTRRIGTTERGGMNTLVFADQREAPILLMLEAIELQYTTGFYDLTELTVHRFILTALMLYENAPMPAGMFFRDPYHPSHALVPWMTAMENAFDIYLHRMVRILDDWDSNLDDVNGVSPYDDDSDDETYSPINPRRLFTQE